MRILAIETSCDETAVAVLEASGGPPTGGFKILSNIVASQVKIHAPWGGVVPNLAKREHQKNLPLILKKALKQAKLSLKNPKIDLMAVTNGPGLEPSLWVGINFAEELAKKWKKPLLGINHLEGHIFSVFLEKNREISNLKFSRFCKQNRGSSMASPSGQISKIKFPILALVVSGGHTELVLIKEWLKYRIIGQTLDDAAGEAFDKVAKMLGLGYPGGPAIAAEAAKIRSTKFPPALRLRRAGEIRNKFLPSGDLPQGDKILNSKFCLPRPMINSKDYNFSFSGLKTAVLYLLRDLSKNATITYDRRELIQNMAHEFQQAVIDVLIKKTMTAVKEYKAKTIILCGGVAANKELRKQLQEKVANVNDRTHMLLPEMEFTGDNAAMIALAAYFRAFKRKKIGDFHKIVADSNLKLR